VRSLPAGRFTAATRALGYVNSDYPPTVLEVRDGERPTEVRLSVWRHASLGGGVVDERGEPITGLPVSALQRVTSGGGLLLRRAATGVTDDRGEYRLSQLAPGVYIVGVQSMPTTLPAGIAAAFNPSFDNRDANRAMVLQLIQSGFGRTYGCDTCISSGHEGHHVGGFVLQRPGVPLPPAPDGRPLGFASTYHPGTVRAQDAAVISIGSGESRTDLEFTVRLTPTVAVSGVLSGPDGPMPHVTLRLVPPAVSTFEFEPAVATAVTDDRGAFAVLGITPGDYTLRSSLAVVTNETNGEGVALWASVPLSVTEDGIAELGLTMQPGVPMSGHVEFKGLSSGEARPAQRHMLNLQPVGAQAWRTVPTVVQPDGRFRSAGDSPGRYIVTASSPPGWFWQTTSVGGKLLPDELVELGLSEIAGLVLTYGRTTNRLSGRVTGESGAADTDAAVIVFPADSEVWREGILSSRRGRMVRTMSTGEYEISTLAPGDYYVAAIGAAPSLNWQDPALLDQLVAGATRVTLGAEDERIVALRTVSVTGR
jgi:hypothetical protein